MKGYQQTLVGDFFEKLTHQIFGGILARNAQGDVYLPKDNLAMEVKASHEKSSYGFRLDLNQIESYRQKGQEHQRHTWYVLYSYRNQRSKGAGVRRTTELSLLDSPESIRHFLAQAVQWCLAVDLAIVCNWAETRPVSKKSIMGHLGTETVDITCREALSYASDDELKWMQNVNLNPEAFERLAGSIDIRLETGLKRKKRVSFPIFLLIQPDKQPSCLKRKAIHLAT